MYSRLSLAGDIPDAIGSSFGPEGKMDFKGLAQRLKAFAKNDQLGEILRDVGLSEDTWLRMADELNKIDTSMRVVPKGLEFAQPSGPMQTLPFASPTPVLNAAAAIFGSPREVFAHASDSELKRLVATPLHPHVKFPHPPTFDSLLITNMWGAVHGMRQKERELKDVGFVVVKGGDVAGAIIVTIGWIILLVGLAVGLTGAVILGLCAGGTITDPTTCDVGKALTVAGAIAIAVGLGTAVVGSFVESGGTVTFGVTVDGRPILEETIVVPPAGP